LFPGLQHLIVAFLQHSPNVFGRLQRVLTRFSMNAVAIEHAEIPAKRHAHAPIDCLQLDVKVVDIAVAARTSASFSRRVQADKLDAFPARRFSPVVRLVQPSSSMIQ